MVSVDLKYVKVQRRRRRRKDGTVWARDYWYYRRLGAPDHGKPLPHDPSHPEFLAALREFNRRAEKAPAVMDAKSFGALVTGYRSSPEFSELSEKSRKDYGRILGKLEAQFGALPYAGITRQVVYKIRDSMSATPRTANYTIAVLRRVLGWAVDRGLLDANPASRPRQLKTKPRDEVWSPEDEGRFLERASPAMRLAFLLAIYSAQRQGDILRMAWTQYDGASLQLRQSKTGRLIKVPCHPTLRAVLDATKRAAVTILTTATGRAFKEDYFRHQWREVTKAAGLEGLQFRDLRRTAMVRLAEAGATDIEIAAVSGHEIETTRRILETYVPRTTAMAQAAISKLERHGKNVSKTKSGKQVGKKVGNTPRGRKEKTPET